MFQGEIVKLGMFININRADKNQLNGFKVPYLFIFSNLIKLF